MRAQQDEAGRRLWAALHAQEELRRYMEYCWPLHWDNLSAAMQGALDSVAHEVGAAAQAREREPQP